MFVCCFQISVDRGMPWDEAYKKAETLTREHEGFYLSHKVLSISLLFCTFIHRTIRLRAACACWKLIRLIIL